jgi:hypothetical protein
LISGIAMEVEAMQSGRSERRMVANTVAVLEAADEPAVNERVVFANISEHGARLITGHYWHTGKQVIVSDSLVNSRTKAEVVYCAPFNSREFVVGLRFK